ncbi:carboxypeptidase regulatory-like domain-containing protein [Acinetobacter lwoffii]|uniref:carboxypeptidase regulatory-like domain-containing protein n=1 Tax=Acinetobacter lwoffii TaxID=28090 RepID=UPI002097680A|nr:carboxypeptidase regulatory-like domain-containing protein [Acinetobacter lwoffii]MCO8082010.1 carboxypeptidase regulatory-like domain-containing protein [Acinetobacter lwoffii]
MRRFFGGYQPNPERLQELGYVTALPLRLLSFAVSADQGSGRIRGETKELGANYSPVPVCVFRRDNRQLLWETKSKADGSYLFRNIAVGLECFVVAFDPNNQYNAVIQDKVIAK